MEEVRYIAIKGTATRYCKLEIVKDINDIIGCGLKEAKDMVYENIIRCPISLLSNMISRLEECGITRSNLYILQSTNSDRDNITPGNIPMTVIATQYATDDASTLKIEVTATRKK